MSVSIPHPKYSEDISDWKLGPKLLNKRSMNAYTFCLQPHTLPPCLYV